MITYGKSALKKNEIMSKIMLGADGIEIQLLDELIDVDTQQIKSAAEVFDLESIKEIPIRVIHAPLYKKTGADAAADVNIEELVNDNYYPLLENIFYIANYFGAIQNEKVLIVLHSEMNLKKVMTMSILWDAIVHRIGCLLDKYPHTEVGIENVVPVQIKEDKLYFRNNVAGDNIGMAIELRKALNTTRIGTVLDTCHADIAKMQADALAGLIEYDSSAYEIEEYFKANKEVIKLIHLANTRGNGLYSPNHGAPFLRDNLEDMVKLHYILSLYEKYNYRCPVTLEVCESDFLKSENFGETKAAIDELIC